MRPGHRIGILGGTFNPVHIGHLVLADRAREEIGLDILYLLPSGSPPHKAAGDLAPAEDRLEMVRLATADHPRLDVLDLEVRRSGTTYTVDTLRQLARDEPGATVYFLIGADSVAELPTWKEASALFDLCRLVTLRRPGHDEGDPFAAVEGHFPERAVASLRQHSLETPLLEVSSTEIRDRLAAGRSVRYLVPEAVLRYVHDRGLYGAAEPDAPTG